MDSTNIINPQEDLDNEFTSGSIDFWTDSTRKEQFGAFVLNLVAERYLMDCGEEMFMSRETRDRLDPELFATGNAVAELVVLEYPLNFERFPGAKKIENVVAWMRESMAEAKLSDEDFGHLSADGGSNAIGSIRDFEMRGREDGRVNSLDFNVCAKMLIPVRNSGIPRNLLQFRLALAGRPVFAPSEHQAEHHL